MRSAVSASFADLAGTGTGTGIGTGTGTGTGTPRQAVPGELSDPATVPRRVRVPAIGVDAELLPLGLDARGAIEVPAFEDAMKAGWFTPGSRPGKPGPTVLVGHRDAPAKAPRRGYRPAVFARLDRLAPGDRVETTSGDGRRVRFRVTAVDTYRTTAFPTRKVYGPVPDSQLRLITCGGALDAAGHWDSNVVVSAVQVVGP
ncbi:sortase domain-containing protein [Streptomyces cavernicola]|uniref:Sortase n=1 Tax=Streptomyces cavernicola TaxID=3043613 RepID=A0ABT6SHV2_9ACTN|nr:sortase [Streptomyces sp. B-S-A6]MDI3407449.1 sortase [Streptomyces sp. B-S-A6]